MPIALRVATNARLRDSGEERGECEARDEYVEARRNSTEAFSYASDDWVVGSDVKASFLRRQRGWAKAGRTRGRARGRP